MERIVLELTWLYRFSIRLSLSIKATAILRPSFRCLSLLSSAHIQLSRTRSNMSSLNKMNVLVYNGPGASPESVKCTIDSLRVLLEPFYAVSPVSAQALRTEPWRSKTSVLVFPGGADLPYTKECKNLIDSIKNFVSSDGGIFIGFCAGGYFASSFCQFAQGDPTYEVSGRRELQFFPGIARGPAYAGFRYNKEDGAKTVRLKVYGKEQTEAYSYYNGGSLFVDAHGYDNVEVLAEYSEQVDVPSSDNDSSRENGCAAVLCAVGSGKALLCGAHPEIAPNTLKSIGQAWYDEDVIGTLKKYDESRFNFLKFLLKKTGLKCNNTTSNSGFPDLTPLFVASAHNSASVQQFCDKLKCSAVSQSEDVPYHQFHGGCDEFNIYEGYHYDKIAHQKLIDVHPNNAVKQILLPKDGSLPSISQTPHFDVAKYFSYLGQDTQLGSMLIYGDVVTSTSVLLDQNKSLLGALPENTVIHVGTIQVSGRGRGGNTWVNPRGSLASTTAINLPSLSPVTGRPLSIVFVQYLAMLAYCKAIRSLSPGFEDLPVVIKWPNDLYALKPEYYFNNKMRILGKRFPTDSVPLTDIEPAFVKISGLLVTTNFINGQYSLLLGCGVNVNNDAPTTSLKSWVNILNAERNALGMEPLSHIENEKLLAKYLKELDCLLNKFIRLGASSILGEYYQYWLHSDQTVRLADHKNSRAKIAGITDDYGLLIAKELMPGSDSVFTGNVFHLQPDGNTFDIFSGLISKKV